MLIIYASCFLLSIVPLIFVWFFNTTVIVRKLTAVLDEVKGVSLEGTLLASSGYPDMEQLIKQDFKEAYGGYRLIYPAILLTLFYVIGFLHIIAFIVFKFGFNEFVHFFPESYTKMLLPPLLSFLGAYLFNFGYMVRRIYVSDVSYTVFWACAQRTLLATGLGIVFSIVIVIQDQSLSRNWYYAFFGIGFLTNEYLRWLLVAGLRKLKKPRQQETSPRLTSISGINFWQESRLEEEGIESVQNLATSDVISIAVQTRFNIATIVDWVDQAILLDRLNKKAFSLKDNGLISGAIDLAWASPQNSDGDTTAAHAVAKVINVEPIFAEMLMDNLFGDVYVQTLWALWQTKFDTGRQVAGSKIASK